MNSLHDKRLGLIAGNGRFPYIFAQEAKREGYSIVAVAHRDETLAEIEDVVDELTWVFWTVGKNHPHISPRAGHPGGHGRWNSQSEAVRQFSA